MGAVGPRPCSKERAGPTNGEGESEDDGAGPTKGDGKDESKSDGVGPTNGEGKDEAAGDGEGEGEGDGDSDSEGEGDEVGAHPSSSTGPVNQLLLRTYKKQGIKLSFERIQTIHCLKLLVSVAHVSHPHVVFVLSLMAN